jgi:uncharacterized phage-like protein YoqJ
MIDTYSAVQAKDVFAGTGHRPDKLGGYDPSVSTRLVDLARASLLKYQPGEVVSGMALGWDTALALAAIEVDIPLTAAVPYEGQERKWKPEQKQVFHTILARATTVTVVSPGGYAFWKMQARNEWMVDRATRVLALWNGGGGGTGNCIAYARARGRDRQPLERLGTVRIQQLRPRITRRFSRRPGLS